MRHVETKAKVKGKAYPVCSKCKKASWSFLGFEDLIEEVLICEPCVAEALGLGGIDLKPEIKKALGR